MACKSSVRRSSVRAAGSVLARASTASSTAWCSCSGVALGVVTAAPLKFLRHTFVKTLSRLIRGSETPRETIRLQRHWVVEVAGVVVTEVVVQSPQYGRAGGPLVGVDAVERAAQLPAASGGDLLYELAALGGEFQRDDAAVCRIRAAHQVA